MGKLFNTAFASARDGIAFIANAISKRLNVSSGSFPSGAHVLALFIFIFVARLLWIVFTYPYSSYGELEEQLLELTTANNFVKYGFLKTVFLPDYVSSSILADHPVVYTHMPPLASVIIALLLKAHMGAFGIRLVLISVNTVGLYYGYLFFKKIFNARVGFVTILLLSLNFKQSFEWSDHIDYCWVWFFLFGAAYHFINFASKNDEPIKKHETILFFLIVLLTSLTSYVILLTQIVLLVLFYLFNIARPKTRYIGVLIGAIFLGVSLHLLQNLIYLGAPTFLQEITLTLKNKIIGKPSFFELTSYYYEHNIVNWASAGFDMKVYVKELYGNVKEQLLFGGGYGWIISAFLLYFAGYNIKNHYKEFIYFWKVMFTFFCAVISWDIAFPAHGQTYFLPICGWGVIPAIVMGVTCVLSIESIRQENRLWKTMITFLLVIMLLTPVFESMKRSASSAYKDIRRSEYNRLSNLTKYSDEVIWANMPSVYVSYFTKSVVAGRCNVEAIKKMDLSFCANVWINSKSLKSIELLKKPTLFVYSKNYLSGDMRGSTPEHLETLPAYLGQNFHLIEKIDNVMIYKIAY